MVPLSLKHVVFQEGDVMPHHLDEGLAERADGRDATSATDWSTFPAAPPRPAETPGPQSPPPKGSWRGRGYSAERSPSRTLTMTVTGLVKPLLVSSHILPIRTLFLASVLQRRETKAQRGWITCPKSHSSLQASLSTWPLYQLSPCWWRPSVCS